jgi:hypothetical protein
VSGIVDLSAIGKSGKAIQSNINANILGRLRQPDWVPLHGKTQYTKRTGLRQTKGEYARKKGRIPLSPKGDSPPAAESMDLDRRALTLAELNPTMQAGP